MPIDWTKPLELMDGTPVRVLAGHEEGPRVYGATVPDRDGHYWLTREDDGQIDGFNYRCADPEGSWAIANVRNRLDLGFKTHPDFGRTSKFAPETPTLRDQFAMAALAMCGGSEMDIAREAYAVADAMLATRKESQHVEG